MFDMKPLSIAILAVSLVPFGASAQIVPPPVPSIVPTQPAPAPPPPPRIDVPEVPKMDAPVKTTPKAAPARRSSYHDRVVACLNDADTARLMPSERVIVSQGCALRAN